jgi:hypothetical protein
MDAPNETTPATRSVPLVDARPFVDAPPRVLLARRIRRLGAFAGTVTAWSWLEQFRLHGIAIVGLIFLAVAALGLALQLGEDTYGGRLTREALGRWLGTAGAMLAVIAGFLAMLWILLLGVHALLDHVLPDGVIAVVYVLLFTWCVAGVIKLLGWWTGRRPRP